LASLFLDYSQVLSSNCPFYPCLLILAHHVGMNPIVHPLQARARRDFYCAHRNAYFANETLRAALARAKRNPALTCEKKFRLEIDILCTRCNSAMDGVERADQRLETIKANFNPAQPRVPAGNSDGGQWTDSGGSSAARQDFIDYLRTGRVRVADSGTIGTDARVDEDSSKKIVRDSQGEVIIDPNTRQPYPHPPNMDIPANVEAADKANLLDMLLWFSHNGLMDYQRWDGTEKDLKLYRNVTNYNYGVVSAAFGLNLEEALKFAGYYNLNFGNPSNAETKYGLSKMAVNNITQGFKDYNKRWNPFLPKKE
jgi:hypothetical protein